MRRHDSLPSLAGDTAAARPALALVRIGASAFVVALTVFGPQSAGVAFADGGARDSSSGATDSVGSETQSATSAAPERPAPVRGRATPPTRLDRVPRGKPATETITEPSGGVADSPVRSDLTRGPNTTLDMSPAETADGPPPIAGGAPSSAAATRPWKRGQTPGVAGDTRGIAESPAAPSPSAEAAGPRSSRAETLPGATAASPPIGPAAGTPADAAAAPATLGAAATAVHPPSAAAAASPAAACADCAVAATYSPQTLSGAVQRILTTTANWLSGLPANPVTDFLQGAVWLVRRTIFPASVGVITAPVTVPLYFTDANGAQKLGIYVALGGSDKPQLFEFDTGGSGFYAAYAPENPGASPWWAKNSPVGTTPVQVKFDSGLKYTGNAVPTTVSLFAQGSDVPLVSTASVTVGQMDSITKGKDTFWTPEGPTSQTPPIQGAFYGDFGASLKYSSNGISGLLAQLSFAPGITPGYRVHVDPRTNQAWVQIGLTPADVGSASGLYFPMVPDSSAPTWATVPYSGARFYSEQLFNADITIAKRDPTTGVFKTVVMDKNVGMTPDTGAQTSLHNTNVGDTPLPTHYAGITTDGKPRLESGLNFSLSGTTIDGSQRDYFQFQTNDTLNGGQVGVQNASLSPLHYLNTGISLFYGNDVVYSMGTSRIPGVIGLIPTTGTTVKTMSSDAGAAAVPVPSGLAAALPVTTASAQSDGRRPGNIFRLFFSNGTAEHPDAGLLIGDGFSYDAASCPGTTPCAGGRGGLLMGNGGNGFNGGNGGNSSLLWGTAGNGGNGTTPVTSKGNAGGNGGNAGLFGTGGTGGIGGSGAPGGMGGRGGLISGDGGDGGAGGAGVAGLALGVGGSGGRGGDASSLALWGNGGTGGRGGTGASNESAGAPDRAAAPDLTGSQGGIGGDGGDGSWWFGSGGQGGVGGNGGAGGTGSAGQKGAHSQKSGGPGDAGGAGGTGGVGGVGGSGGSAGTGHVLLLFRTTGLAGPGGVGGPGGTGGAGGEGGRGGDGSSNTPDGGTGGTGGDGGAGGTGGIGGTGGSGRDGVPGNGGAGGGGGSAGAGGKGGAGFTADSSTSRAGNGGAGGDPGAAGAGGSGGVQGPGCGCARNGIDGPAGASMTSGGDGGAGGDGYNGGIGGNGGDGGQVGNGGDGGNGGNSDAVGGNGGNGGVGGKYIGSGGDGGNGGKGDTGRGGTGGNGGPAQAKLSAGGYGGNGGNGISPGADGGDGGNGGNGGSLGTGGGGGTGGKAGPGGKEGNDGQSGSPRVAV